MYHCYRNNNQRSILLPLVGGILIGTIATPFFMNNQHYVPYYPYPTYSAGNYQYPYSNNGFYHYWFSIKLAISEASFPITKVILLLIFIIEETPNCFNLASSTTL